MGTMKKVLYAFICVSFVGASLLAGVENLIKDPRAPGRYRGDVRKEKRFRIMGQSSLSPNGVGVLSGFGQLSPAIAYPPMFNGTVQDAVVYGGKTYAVGDFNKVSEERLGYGIPLDKTNGQPLSDFDTINGPIYNVIEDGAGGWFVTGDFTQVGTTDRVGFAHFLSNGKLDPSWNLDAGINGWFDKMCLLDGNLYLLVELSPSVDTTRLELHSYNIASRSKTNGWVLFNGDSHDSPFIYVIKSAKDRIYFGGLFSSLQNESKNNLAAFDTKSGRIDSSWVGETNSIVNDLFVTEKDLIIGGSFSTANRFNRKGVAAFDLVSGKLSDWNPNLGGTGISVESIGRIGDTIYLAGRFETVGGFAANRFAGVGQSDGKNRPHLFGDFATVNKIVTSGTTIYFSGYRKRNATTWDNLWAFEQSGVLTGWAPQAGYGEVQMAAGDKAIFISVEEGFLGGEKRNGLAVFNSGTGKLEGFNPDLGGVTGLYLDQDTLFVAKRSNGISAINLSSQSISPWLKGTTFDGPVNAITKKGNVVYVGGEFKKVNNSDRFGLAAFAFDSGTLLSWSPKVEKKDGSMSVKTLAVSDDLILVGGRFETINSYKRDNLAAINVKGVLQAWTPIPNNAIEKIIVDGNNIYVGGQFDRIGASGDFRNGFAAFDSSSLALLAWDMKLDHSRGYPPAVLGISVSNGHVYVSGFFDQVNETPVNGVAAFKRSDWTLTSWRPHIGDSTWNYFVRAYSDQVLIGGEFFTANGQIQRELAVVAPVDAIPTVPMAPEKFVVSQRSSTTLSLQWDPSAGATSYSVKVTAPLTLVKENITTSFTLLDSLTPNTQYEVGVKACNAMGCSAFSTAETFTWAAVPGLSTTSVLGTSIGLKIDTNGNPKGTIYEFQQVDSPDGFIIKSESSDFVESVIDHLNPDTSYFYRVYAKNLDGSLTGPSSVLTVKTGLIANLLTKSIDRVSSTNIGASWSIDPPGSSFKLVASTLSANPLDSFVRVQKVVEPKGMLTDLTPNTRYNLFVLPCEEDRCNNYVDLGSMTTLANVPSLMVVTLGQNNQALRIQPNGNPAGTFYVVEKSEDKGMTFVSMYEGTDPGVDLSDLPAGKIFHFRVTAKNLDGLFTSSSEVIPYESSHHSIEQTRAYPVPFRSGSETKFLTFDSFPPDSTIDIYNLNGEQVKTITPSANSYQWDVRNQEGEDVASGVYFVRVSGSGGDKTFKIVVQR